jgi:hypothetical protein
MISKVQDIKTATLVLKIGKRIKNEVTLTSIE